MRDTYSSADSGERVPRLVGYAMQVGGLGEMEKQLASLHGAGCTEFYTDDLSAAAKDRPAFRNLLGAIQESGTDDVAGNAVVVCLHDLKSLGRGAAEIATSAAELWSRGVALRIVNGGGRGSHDPSDESGTLYPVLLAMADSQREQEEKRAIALRESARRNGRRGGRPKLLGSEMESEAVRLRDQGVPIKEIPAKLIIPTGKRKGQHPSVATVYRILAKADAAKRDADPIADELDELPRLAPGHLPELQNIDSAKPTESSEDVQRNPEPASFVYGRRWRRRRAGRQVRNVVCPSCGTESGTNESVAREIAADLEFIWLELSLDGKTQACSHCSLCQPADRWAIECDHRLCAEGPILGGELALAGALPSVVREWLERNGWWVGEGTLLCAEHAPTYA